MKSFLFRTVLFLRHWFFATPFTRTHSPFVFEFHQKILNDHRTFYAFETIRQLRTHLEKDHRSIIAYPLVTESGRPEAKSQTISSVAKHSTLAPDLQKIIFRLILINRPTKILEIGTSLGLTTLLMHLANPKAQIITLEGNPELCKVAKENFSRFDTDKINLMEGDFEKTLPVALSQVNSIDLVFFDGNHRYLPTVAYFENCLKKAHGGSIFAFDDIHWSPEMRAAWKYVSTHPRVTLSIDLFRMGLLFFSPDFHQKRQFRIFSFSSLS